jgi:hypothetical protein
MLRISRQVTTCYKHVVSVPRFSNHLIKRFATNNGAKKKIDVPKSQASTMKKLAGVAIVIVAVVEGTYYFMSSMWLNYQYSQNRSVKFNR